ncbi:MULTISPECIES: hypothetical protein [unclassified Vibrio]|uniref:hypothetical protein n=1 Tax=unclassified Vibrio TaxID=2614977 RepID=UPI000B8ED132|nr:MULTISPECIES: hypothetical protein [unclassified Vibrio]NAW91716.1 hypothetical protein [Vibrio sp. V24_P1S3T111]OXX19169.1 hypothetical protein B9J86_16315 [Vibrio sp. V06_P1A73T115]OXX24947.1 hypothetical protein B9J88_04750 [Vibrio sp. V05_P4A8T149]OXX36318.1 hypothetical protein B9J81_06500 [Vibrio sp. V04_P4A5T148]OXX55076.1 hypothetical protein B9J91_09995 [Vibrio sp. V18_P1S4T112]
MADWLEEENQRAQANVETGQTENSEAPRMVLVKSKRVKKPQRKTRGIYVQDKIWKKYDLTVYKMKGVKSAPDLAEEALQYIIDKYGSGKNG